MAAVGLNVSGDGEITPASLRDLGAKWARVVLLPQFDLNSYIDALGALGIKALGVIARESLGPGPMSYGDAARLYSERYGNRLGAVQCGNESDHESPSSWTMTHADLNSLLSAFNRAFPNTLIVGPGLVSGDATWVRGIDLDLLDAIAAHPYGQRPGGTEAEWSDLPGNFGDVNALLDRYAAEAPGKRLWVTEVGVSTTQVSEAFQARYCEAMLRALASRADLDAAIWFCMGDWMVEKFGLYRGDGSPKPAADAFTRVAREIVEPPPPPPPPELVYAIDVHSEWGRDLSEVIARHNPGHVILHTYHRYEAAGNADIFRQQVASVQAAGRTVGCYVWAFQTHPAAEQVQDAVTLFRRAAGHDPPVVWIDCEPFPGGADPGPDVDWLHVAGLALDVLGLRRGIYTSPGYAHDRWGERAHELADWLLWLAHWNGDPHLTSSYLPLYGWQTCQAKQWAVDLPGQESIDRDVILPEYTTPGVVVEPDKDAIIEGLRIALDDVGYVRLGANIAALEAALSETKAIHAELRRIRQQMLGP